MLEGRNWDSDLVVEQTFTFDDVFRMWQMGKRYTYNIDFTLLLLVKLFNSLFKG